MTDGECEELITFLRGEFIEIREPELAGLAQYTVEKEEGWVKPGPRERLVKMLDAFEAIVALEDRATYWAAKEQIEKATNGSVPEFRVEMVREGTVFEGEKIAFHLHDQSDIREGLLSLRAKIEEDEGPDGASEFER